MRIDKLYGYSLSVPGLAAAMSSPALAAEAFSPCVDGQGTISVPGDFRTKMVHLGSWFVPDGDANGFHDVYTEPQTVAAYRRSGQFPDGATLVTELSAADTGDYTTDKNVVHAAASVKQWTDGRRRPGT